MMSKMKYDTPKTGLCAIISNFVKVDCTRTDNMTLHGYEEDVSNIQKLFSDTEKFDFVVHEPYQNLHKSGFQTALQELQTELQNPKKGKKYDKFVLFVLSHGDEGGILMYDENVEKCEYELLTEEEIIDSFSHDIVPALKDVPKCFFFQACRGEQETRAAGDSKSTKQCETSNYHMPIVTRANILVAHATLNHKTAYVHPNYGSFFIRNLIAVMEVQSQAQDIYSILTEVTAKSVTDDVDRYFKCNKAGVKIIIKDKEVVLVGKWKEGMFKSESDKKQLFPLSLSEDEDNYVIPHKLADYTFCGKIYFEDNKKMLPWKDNDNTVSADKLTIFTDRAFKIEGTLQSKLNKMYKCEGTIKIQGEEVFVNDCKPTHGVNIGDLDIMVKENDTNLTDQVKNLTDPNKFNGETGTLHILGKLQGHGKFMQKGHVWGIQTKVYQLSVFASTLTKHLYLTKLGWGEEGLSKEESVQPSAENNDQTEPAEQTPKKEMDNPTKVEDPEVEVVQLAGMKPDKK